jgi:hypothetical protein
MATDLVKALDPAWGGADPAPYAPEHAAHVAELEALDPGVAELYRLGSAALAGAPDVPALRERHVALLGRERGAVTLALAEMPKLSVDRR